MALFIDKNHLVDDTVFEYERKISSKAATFQETTSIPVTFYLLAEERTTMDTGYHDVESLIGGRSPLRFKKITNFPLHAIEQMVLQLDDSDRGLDTSYEGDATIRSNTIRPVQNSYFKIPHLHGKYLFRVIEVQYDVLIKDGFYKIRFELDSIDESIYDQIDKQVVESFVCIEDNIGTNQDAIIKEECKTVLDAIDAMYEDMVETYLVLFFDKVHNDLLYNDGVNFYYDPLMTEFVNKHRLFNRKDKIDTYYLSDQFIDAKRKIKYEKSIYRFIERRDYKSIDYFGYMIKPITDSQTSFIRWGRNNVYFLDIPISRCEANIMNMNKIFGEQFVLSIMNGNIPDYSSYSYLIGRYLLDNSMTINDIPLDLNQWLIDMNDNIEVFLLTPIVLYIIRYLINETIKNKK